MNQGAFVLAAYIVALAGTAGLLISAWLRMRSAERAADALKSRQ